ncbi:hypothetical protein [Sorangium sp. So ce1182]|uniref:hypothetical protein n=1 Tax=Sorangium sp. So ce1182 TaxID=3133334 RepID=UPI003F61299F
MTPEAIPHALRPHRDLALDGCRFAITARSNHHGDRRRLRPERRNRAWRARAGGAEVLPVTAAP